MSEKLTVDQRLAISDKAAQLHDDPTFNAVISTLTRDYMLDLMNTDVGSQESMMAHAGLKALNGIKERLVVLKNDGVVLRKQLKTGSQHSATP